MAEHSFRVCLIANYLIDSIYIEKFNNFLPEKEELSEYLELRAHVLQEALIHDLGEKWTGDVGHHIKRKYPELRRELAGVEDREIINFYNFTDFTTPSDKKRIETIVKCADIIDFCYESYLEILSRNPEQEYRLALLRGQELLNQRLETTTDSISKSVLQTTKDIIFEFSKKLHEKGL